MRDDETVNFGTAALPLPPEETLEEAHRHAGAAGGAPPNPKRAGAGGHAEAPLRQREAERPEALRAAEGETHGSSPWNGWSAVSAGSRPKWYRAGVTKRILVFGRTARPLKEEPSLLGGRWERRRW